jgi:hypothetical protein
MLSDAVYANMCQHLTDSSGNFSSQRVPKPADDIHSERVFDATLKTTVLISVQPNQQIWLTFKKCVTLEHQHFVNVISYSNCRQNSKSFENFSRFTTDLTQPVLYCYRLAD